MSELRKTRAGRNTWKGKSVVLYKPKEESRFGGVVQGSRGQLRKEQRPPTKTPTRLRDEGPTAAGGRGKGEGQAVAGLAAEGCG